MISWRGLPLILIGVGMASLCSATDRILVDRLGPTQATLFISNADGGGDSLWPNRGHSITTPYGLRVVIGSSSLPSATALPICIGFMLTAAD